MIAKTYFYVLAVILLAFARVAVADLYGIHDPSIVGNGNAPQDGFNLTRDTDTALDWPDITLSLDRSYDYVSTQFGAGGEYEGFRFATTSEMETLFVDSAGLMLEDTNVDPVTGLALDPDIYVFQSLFGTAPFEEDKNISAGQFDDQDVDFEVGFAGVVDRLAGDPPTLVRVCPDGCLEDPNVVQSWLGAWLVRPSCDFSSDGNCDIDDIDALIMEIAEMPTDTLFDLNGDGAVDLADRDEWLAQAGAMNLPSANPYLVADFTLDGVVDGQDFIVWNNSKFTNTGKWSMGDANGDGVTDGQDFILWNNNKFMSSDGVSAVPEPGTGVFLIAVLMGFALVRRR